MHPTVQALPAQGDQTMSFEIKTAAELTDPELEARWVERREGREAEVFRYMVRAFADSDGQVLVHDVHAAFAHWPLARVRDELTTLDESDLILLEEDEVRLAYPFSATPTPFIVRLEDGRERF